MSSRIHIRVVGDFNPQFHSHAALNAAVEHAATATGLPVDARWLPTPDVDVRRLAEADGLWISPGSPYRSFDGALRAIEFARTSGRPLAAT